MVLPGELVRNQDDFVRVRLARPQEGFSIEPAPRGKEASDTLVLRGRPGTDGGASSNRFAKSDLDVQDLPTPTRCGRAWRSDVVATSQPCHRLCSNAGSHKLDRSEWRDKRGVSCGKGDEPAWARSRAASAVEVVAVAAWHWPPARHGDESKSAGCIRTTLLQPQVHRKRRRNGLGRPDSFNPGGSRANPASHRLGPGSACRYRGRRAHAD